MAIHMIRVMTSVSGDYDLSQLNAAMDDWVSKQAEWVEDHDPHQMRTAVAAEGGTVPDYRDGSYRFFLSDAKDNLIQKCEDKLVNKVDWYRLGYHECDHDQEERDGCSWDEQREDTAKDVTIPDHVPVFIEDQTISMPVDTLTTETPTPSIDTSGGGVE